MAAAADRSGRLPSSRNQGHQSTVNTRAACSVFCHLSLFSGDSRSTWHSSGEATDSGTWTLGLLATWLRVGLFRFKPPCSATVMRRHSDGCCVGCAPARCRAGRTPGTKVTGGGTGAGCRACGHLSVICEHTSNPEHTCEPPGVLLHSLVFTHCQAVTWAMLLPVQARMVCRATHHNKTLRTMPAAAGGSLTWCCPGCKWFWMA